jgi:uncharacterized membrane protein YdjX (TVP38/TMEM64 family)
VTAFITFGIILLLPSSLLMMLAGFLFGLLQGFASVWIATLVASTIAFWIGRSVARPWIERKIRRKSTFVAIDRAIRRKGFFVVLLTRLVIVLPLPALSYTHGLTSVCLRDYMLGTNIGMVPSIFLFVFLGTTAGDLAAIISGEVSLQRDELIIGLAALAVVLIIVALIIRAASRALKEELASAVK